VKDRGQAGDTITFLGTGGARFVVINQFLATGGLWLNLDGTELLIDPGPGCIIQSTKRKLKSEKLSAIIISHRHIDHCSDLNIMAEGMTGGGLKHHGSLFAPADALESDSVIFSYLKNLLEKVEYLQEGKSYSIDNISFTTPVRHIHPVETYGIRFDTGRHTFSYIADTRFFDGICQQYRSDLLIMNVVFLESGLPFDHLSAPDAERIISELKPKIAIMTHFGMSMWCGKPWEIARDIFERTGIKVIAARDGMRFDLVQLDES
jgi:ribonuclease BN (tRNA processing enzyme)